MKKKFIIEKYSDEEQRELANVLKSKRIELGKNLDEVAEGVCSTSYLSRIENNLVRFQEPYLKMLFEKLNIDYDTLKESRRNNLFVEIVKKVLMGCSKEYQDDIVKIMESNCFLGTERDLIILYDNILTNKYEETQYFIDRLQTVCNHFSNGEMAFFMYLVALYYYKINQYTLAYSQIKILTNMDINDEIIEWLIKELSMDVYYSVGKKLDYIMLYVDFVKNAPLPFFKDLLVKQRFKMITLESESSYSKALIKMEEYKESLASLNIDIQTEFYYNLGIIHLLNGKYQEAINTLISVKPTVAMIKILSFALLNLEKSKRNDSFEKAIDVINNYGFTKFDDLAKNICYYVSTKLENKTENSPRLLNFLKNNVFNLLETSFDYMVYCYTLMEIFQLNMKCSKYKDSCNLILKLFNGFENKLLNN